MHRPMYKSCVGVFPVLCVCVSVGGMGVCVCSLSKCTTHTRAVILLHKYTHTRTCYILYIQSIWFSRKVAGVIHTYSLATSITNICITV